MLQETLITKLRHKVKKMPFVAPIWFNTRLIFKPTYREDGLCTVHNADFIKSSEFVKGHQAAEKMQPGTTIRWRCHVAQWAGHQASLLEGDFVECGVNRAYISTSVMESINFKEMQERNFYLVDTYCGLAETHVDEKDKAAHWNEYPDVYEFVQNAFKDYSNVKVVKGLVPDILSEVKTEKVAYLSIDMNCAAPEIAAIKHFWPKMLDGGIILIDDYGWRGHEAQKEAADDFAKSVGQRVLAMPTGQGILIKH